MFDQVRIQDFLSEIINIYPVNILCTNLPEFAGCLDGYINRESDA